MSIQIKHTLKTLLSEKSYLESPSLNIPQSQIRKSTSGVSWTFGITRHQTSQNFASHTLNQTLTQTRQDVIYCKTGIFHGHVIFAIGIQSTKIKYCNLDRVAKIAEKLKKRDNSYLQLQMKKSTVVSLLRHTGSPREFFVCVV